MNNIRFTALVAGLFLAGPIITMKDDGLLAEAVATRDGKIIAVDRLRTIEAMAGETTERIDLARKTMMPAGSQDDDARRGLDDIVARHFPD